MNTLQRLLQNGKTQFHVVKECIQILSENGYRLLDMNSIDNLAPGKYMVSPYSSMLVAFSIDSVSDIRIAAAHTDFPMLKIKPKPDITRKGYCELNVEPYGGLIKESWFDRPLGIAGKLVVKGENAFTPRAMLFDSKEPVCVIPSLAPHMRRNQKSDEMDVQKELIPVLCTKNSTDTVSDASVLMSYISNELSINEADILDYDLYLYNYEPPVTVGLNKEFITAARIDNLSSVSAILNGLCSTVSHKGCIIGAFFDNEEIGSRSKQGADSMLLRDIIERITGSKKALYGSISLSVDVAHATHPNYAEKSDITNDITLGDGVVIKSSASQRYVTDSEAGAIIVGLCREKNIKYIRQANRSGAPGGQTLGPLMSSYLPIKSVDIGIPMLAMHSASELVSISDYNELCRLISEYFLY